MATPLEFIVVFLHICISIVSISLNLLLLFVVFLHTPKTFSTFGIMLKFHVLSDFTHALSGSASMIRLIPLNWSLAYFMYGPCGYFGVTACYLSAALMIGAESLAFNTILASFIFRLMVIRGRSVTSRASIGLICFVSIPLPTLLMVWNVHLSCANLPSKIVYLASNDDHLAIRDLLNEIHPEYNADSHLVAGHIDIRTPLVATVIVILGAFIWPIYVVMLYLRSRILASIEEQSGTLSDRSRQLHRKFVSMLTAQASLPILPSVAIITFFFGFFDIIHHPALESATMMLGEITAVFSPLIVLHYVDHYRGMVELTTAYYLFSYLALFLISIYFLIAIFLIVAVQLTQLHQNCKFLLTAWGTSYMIQFACFAAIFTMNTIASSVPLNKNDPPIRSYFISATTGTQLFCECLEIIIASERIFSSIDPAVYHLSGRNNGWLFSLTMFSAIAAFVHASICQVNLHHVLAAIVLAIEICSLIMNFAAVRYCGRRSNELYGRSSLNARYQVKEACELAASMQRAYLVTFIAKNLVNSVVLVGCFTLDANNECVPLLYPLPYMVVESTFSLGYSTTSAFLLLSLLHNHPRLRLKANVLLSKIRRTPKIQEAIEPLHHTHVSDAYFEGLKKTWS